VSGPFSLASRKGAAKLLTPMRRIHLDIKKLGRIGSVGHHITGRYRGAVNRHHGIGREFVHVCIDDTSRVAFRAAHRARCFH
jgi:hypothetical protein